MDYVTREFGREPDRLFPVAERSRWVLRACDEAMRSWARWAFGKCRGPAGHRPKLRVSLKITEMHFRNFNRAALADRLAEGPILVEPANQVSTGVVMRGAGPQLTKDAAGIFEASELR